MGPFRMLLTADALFKVDNDVIRLLTSICKVAIVGFNFSHAQRELVSYHNNRKSYCHKKMFLFHAMPTKLLLSDPTLFKLRKYFQNAFQKLLSHIN